MLRFMGALCVLAGAGGFGFMMARGLADRVANLQRVTIALQHLESEITFAALPLAMALHEAARAAGGAVGDFLRDVSAEISRQGGEPLAQVWRRLLLSHQAEMLLAPDEAAVLAQLGMVLGGSDREDQRKHLVSAQASFIRFYETTAAKADKAKRVWQYLGFALGAMAVIILY